MADDTRPDDQYFDLILDRVVPVTADKLWLAWTHPDHLVHWFTPTPWRTVSCDLDLRPGGRFDTVMESGEGERFSNRGCILEVVPRRRLVFTDILGENYRPLPLAGDVHFTAVLTLEPTADGLGTRYLVVVMHPDEASRRQHEAMGFHDGWSRALDQLVAYTERL